MQVFSLHKEQEWNRKHHVEKVLGEVGDGDVTVTAGSQARSAHIIATPTQPRSISALRAAARCARRRKPSTSCRARSVHPPGELHEYINGPQRTLLFRVRYGEDMSSRHFEWRNNPEWKQSPRDANISGKPAGGERAALLRRSASSDTKVPRAAACRSHRLPTGDPLGSHPLPQRVEHTTENTMAKGVLGRVLSFDFKSRCIGCLREARRPGDRCRRRPFSGPRHCRHGT
jgi:hypothetical protein